MYELHRTPRGSVRFTRLLAVAGSTAVAVSVAALPSSADVGQGGHVRFRQVNLVSDVRGMARVTDPHLVNAWGLSAGPETPLWVSDNGADRSTLYAGAQPGRQVQTLPLVVSIPGGAPTGNAFNPTTAFRLTSGGKSGPARFVFAGEGGDLSAWNPSGNPTQAVRVAHTSGAVYKGIALLQRDHPVLLLADFHGNRVDVFDSAFHRVATHEFASAHVPRGYAPFNVAVLRDRVYVSYALQDRTGHDDVAGAGHGFVNVFDRSGRFLRQLVRGGVLDSPWGLTLAPSGFGSLGGELLVGNFGDGRIHAFDPRTGHLVATLRSPSGSPLVIEGLWGLLPGNGTAGARSDVWFSAGPGDEAHGLLGVLRAAG